MPPSVMETRYSDYIRSNDTRKLINGTKFYKAVDLEQLHLYGKKVVCIVLPYEIFDDNGGKITDIVNEKGNSFRLKGPAMIHFIDEIPEWYFRCGEFLIEDYECPFEEFGQYFTVARTKGRKDT